MGDPERYRQPEEVKKWEESDPIGLYRKYLTESKVAAAKSLDDIDEHVMDEVREAVEFAEASPEPTMEDLYKDVYADA
jgi:pyruvate dehydrogenase E1 component alpha subunit